MTHETKGEKRMSFREIHFHIRAMGWTPLSRLHYNALVRMNIMIIDNIIVITHSGELSLSG